jgi:alpha-tubulin suppressor-like RCC1 family protein
MGDFTNRVLPTPVTLLDSTEIQTMYLGRIFTMILRTDGRLVSFGSNSLGELGQNELGVMVPTPQPVNFGFDVDKITFGNSHVFILTNLFGVPIPYGFGSNGDGQLGLGISKNQISPITTDLLVQLKLKDIVAAGEVTFGIDGNNTVFCWGNNKWKQLALPRRSDRLMLPEMNPLLTNLNFERIIGGDQRVFGITRDRKIYVWGACRDDGLLGIFNCQGNTTVQLQVMPTPLDVFNGKNISSISIGLSQTFVRAEDNWYSFGANTYGELAIGDIGPQDFIQKAHVINLRRVRQIVTGYSHTLFLDENDVYGLGLNQYGQLGLGDTVNRFTANRILTLSHQNVTRIFAGSYFSFVSTSNNSVYGFGDNKFGQLGLGHILPIHAPTIVDFFTGMNLSDIQIGLFHAVALTTSGDVYSWGSNEYYHLGLWVGSVPSQVDVHIPTWNEELRGIPIVKIDCGSYHTLAIGADKKLYGWGRSDYGQLGGKKPWTYYVHTSPKIPLQITNLTADFNPTMVGCGYWHSVIASNTSIATWGKGANGQLGNGATVSSISATYPIGIPPGITDIQVGPNHNFIQVGASVYAMGVNRAGQLGIGNFVDQLSPVFVANDTIQVIPGYEYSIFVYKEELFCYGITSTNPIVCGGKGSCLNFDTCVCNPQYGSRDCSQPYCFGILGKDPKTCNGHGKCIAPDVCDCDFGKYGGTYCNVTVCNGKMQTDSTVCNSHGQCLDDGKCNCTYGFIGTDCEFPSCYGKGSTDSSVCTDRRGTCASPDNCTCDENLYVGKMCETLVCDGLNATHPNVCSSNGNCTSPNGCQCNKGYFGTVCADVTCYGVYNNETTRVCNGNGICQNPDSCECYEGFLGDQCTMHWSTMLLCVFASVMILSFVVSSILAFFDLVLVKDSIVIFQKQKFEYRSNDLSNDHVGIGGSMHERLLQDPEIIKQ